MRRSTITVIGVDPGATTGLVLFTDDKLRESLQVSRTEVVPHVRAWLQQIQNSRVQTYAVIAIERFQIGAQTIRSSRQTDASDIIGALIELAREFNARVLKQNPGDAKKMGSPERLKKIHWWNPGQDHANDAAAHALLALAKLRPSAFADIIGI